MNEVFQPGFGAQLKAGREARGLAVADVAAKLKLTGRQVEALEAEDLSHLPNPVFVRGFVRNYARLVDLEPDSLIAPLDAQTTAAETITAPSAGVAFANNGLRQWVLYPMVAFGVFILLVAILYHWLRQGEATLVTDPAAAVQAPAPVQEPVAPAPSPAQAPEPSPAPGQTQILPLAPSPQVLSDGTPPQPAPAAAPPSAPAPNPAPAPQSGPAPKPAAQPAPPAPPAAGAAKPAPVAPPAATPRVDPPAPNAKPAAAAPAQATPAGLPPPAVATAPVTDKPAKSAKANALRFEPSQDAWIQVVDGKGNRFSKLVRAGTAESFTGEPPFRLVVGEAAKVRMSFNGHVIDLTPFIGQKVARLTLE